MISQLRIPVLPLVLFSIFISSCQPNHDKPDLTEELVLEEKEPTLNLEEEEIKAVVERLLIAAGNYNMEDLDDLTSDKAMIGICSWKDGVWSNSEVTIDEYFDNVKKRELKPYCELVSDYNIILTEGQLALVRADAILHRFGIPQTREINHFTLMKENAKWKFLNIAFTVTPIAEEERKFDLDIFAHSYAQAWSSKKPEFVASYFTENGSLQVNDVDLAKGRNAISKIAQGFMIDLPDMIVHYDSLVTKSDAVEFHWTLMATNSGPGGTGSKIEVSGFERWQVGENGLISESKGSFPSEEYKKQLEVGIEVKK